ncbi:MAG: sulfatase, partial [Deltaproteobacteria bacterium]|nr:sulfatase [Deltaproteobacteria bacterium]
MTQRYVFLEPGVPVRFTGFAAPGQARLELEWVPPMNPGAEAVRLQVARIDASGGRDLLVDERLELSTPFGRSSTKHQWSLVSDQEITGLEFSVSPWDDASPLRGRIAAARPRLYFEQEIPASPESAPPPTQIILVTLDTFRSDYLGCYGNTRVKTPSFDALARDSTLFSETYSTANVTKPSHFSIFTSSHVKDHGVDDNFKALGADTPSMIEALRKRGFRIAAFLAAYNFSAKQGSFSARFDDYFPTAVRDRRAGDVNADVIPWMHENRNRDFFAWIHYFDAHAPYSAPYPYNRAYQQGDELEFPAPTSPDYSWTRIRQKADRDVLRKLYMGEVSYIDDEFGKLVAKLEQLGIYDRATIVLTADHGDAHGELGLWAVHRGLTDGTTRVPLLYKRPFGMPRGRIDGLVSTLDIYPTIFDWLGFEIAHPHRGVSLRPLMEQGMDSKREAVFSHHAHDYQVSVRTRDQRATLGLQDMVFGKQGAGYSISKDRMEVYDYSDPVAGRETVGP